VYCDIGGTGKKSDAFTMWIVQFVSREIRVLNYYEAVGQEFKDHMAWLRENDYGPAEATIWLPHDGATHDKVHRVSYESAFRGAGYRVKVVPNQGTGAATERIREARKLFPMMYFDKQKCAAGIEALSNYAEKWDDLRNIGLGPHHNWASHGADSFGMMAIAYRPPVPHGAKKPQVRTLAGMRGRR
jgi:phage terminase large subunit